MSAWANIATIVKADKSKRGGLFAQGAEGLPLLLSEGMTICFVPPVLHVPRSGVIQKLETHGSHSAWLRVSSIDSLDKAEQLIGHCCLARKSELPYKDSSCLSRDFEEFRIFDTAGNYLGIVSAVEPNPAHPLLVVSRGVAFDNESVYPADALHSKDPLFFEDNSFGKGAVTTSVSKSDNTDYAQKDIVRIPLVDEFIVQVDHQKRILTLAVPEGLLDI